MKFTTLKLIAFVTLIILSSLVPTKAISDKDTVKCLRELKSCWPAFRAGNQPSADCCRKLKESQCLCVYLNPPFNNVFYSENVSKL
ncbi:hypothetical protein EUTSA_v10006394mg [Eutrema salsugineum]|uniref:Bifunctional inhibitor/plant lipid transfer protein/seed storage helical domain-containing protein n=1 Tax=Eutrema salsugineum TaxID=72664 RepID=V4L229_EUTSA|nr:hypothetical protein EUTSA_v10006394mg [Eutrema salsugineum]